MNEQRRLPRKGSRIHLIGIGGIGMSALVPALRQLGYKVSGSDKERNAVADRLEAQGIEVFIGHKKEQVKDAALVVASAAVKATNIEIKEAKTRGIPVWHRAELLGYFLQGKRSVVIAGAHGKTSITGMAARLLNDAGLQPSAFIGGDIVDFGGNALAGEGEWAVAEGDESDGSFVNLKPEIAIVNNIDADHLDYYRDLDAIVESYQRFVDGIRPNGWLLRSADCETCARLTVRDDIRVMTYGFDETADMRGIDYRRNGHGWRCDVYKKNKKRGRIKLRGNGRMNYHNALAVAALADVIGMPFAKVKTSLAAFSGVKRRMEDKGTKNGVTVVDDYAHHPSEIRATIDAMKERGARRIIAVFQPHLYSRTRLLIDEFAQSFAGVDLLVVTDIYAARETPEAGFSGETLCNRIRKERIPVVYVPNRSEVPRFLDDVTKDGDVCLTLGAGDIWKAGEDFVATNQDRNGCE